MKKFKKRLDTPSKKIRIEGLDLIPKNPDGTVVYGTYKIEYVWDYDGVTIRTPRILEFLPPNKRIEWRKGDIAIGGVEAIQVIAIGSQEPYHPTKYTNVDITFPNDIEAWFVDRDQDGNIVFEVQLNTTITTDDSMVQAALINDEIPEGNYSIFYSTEYEYESVIYTRTITRKLTSVKHRIKQQILPLYSGRWEPNRLQAINLDCHRPAAGIDPGVVGDDFPTNQEIADTIPTYILTHRDTGEEIRFETDIVYPSFPSSIPTATTLYVASFHAVNQVSGSGASTGLSQADFDTFVTPASPINRSIQYGASTFVPPPPFTEITFNISSLDDIVYQDYLSGSNPVPVYYNNGGLFPTETQLLNGVEATYVDSDGVTQNLTVTVNRPDRAKRPGDLGGFYDGNEVDLSVPREWPITYTATAPDGTVNTAVRKVIVEDTTAPIFNKQFPTTVEKGSNWDEWSFQFNGLAFYGINHPVPNRQYGIERTGVSFVSSIDANQFNSLEHGDTFTLTATTTDRAGNQATMSQVVTCEDTTSPTISFDRFLSFPTGSNPTETQLLNGYNVNDLSTPVTTIIDDSSVDYSAEGIYSATYTATDPHGNSFVSTRSVLVYGAAVTFPPVPPSGVPVACPMTPGVPNITIGSHTDISSYTDQDWIVGLNAAQGSEDVTFKIVVDPITVAFVPKNLDGTMDYDLDGDGYTDAGVTTYFINYEIQAPDGTPLICTSRLIEIQDSLAPSINSVPNPLVINVTPDVTTPADVLTEIRALIDVVDNVDGTNYNMAFLEGLTQSEINSGSTSVKTIRFIDLSGNESRAENITLQLVINDSDGDGIPDSRDQFPFDINYTTDIDGDGVGDDDSVVIWHHDFEDTLSYLEVRETEINTNLTLNGSAASPIYATVFSRGAQKKGVQITNNDFHIETNNLDGTPIDIKNTSINFAMSMEVTTPNGGFELEDTDLGRMIYFYSAGSSNKTPSILDIKIKKLQHNTTGDISYRFSIYTLAKNRNNSDIAASSMYSNSTNSGVAYLDLTDLSEYTVLNGNGGDELHGTESGDYGIEHFITNFDLPLDSQLHAYSIVFEPRFDTSTGHQIAIYMDGELKQLFMKSSGANYGFHQGSVSYNLYGKASTILTDYIWTTYTDIDKVVAIQNKMLNASFSIPTIFGDQDNDGLLDIQEDMLGPQFDKTNPNTDANLVVNHTDELDDFIENHVIRFATPLSTTPVIGGNAYTKSSQIDLSQDEFVRYFAGGIKWGTNLSDAQNQYGGLHIADSTTQSYTVAFWWYNNGTIGSSGGVFTDPNDGSHPGLAWNNTGFYVKRNNGYAGTSTVYGDQNFGTYCSDAFTADGAQWKHFAAVLDIENSEVRIYLDAQLFDTVPDWRGAYSKVVASSFPQWTDFVMFDAKLEQSKIQQLFDRRKAAEYDLRNQYPIIVDDPSPLITGFNYESVDTDYTDTILSDGLAYTINGDQTHSSTIVHKYQLTDAISATGSDGGVHEILIETISGDNIRTYTRREVVISEPLRGFLEELPFMPTPSGTATFSSLTWDSMIPDDEGASVTVPFPEHGRSANGDFTLSMWIPDTDLGGTGQQTTPDWFIINSPSGVLARIQIGWYSTIASFGALRTSNFNQWQNVGLGNVAHLVWVVTSSDNKCRLYLNGSLVSTMTTVPNDMQTATEIFISNIPFVNYPRSVDSVDVLGGALEPERVLEIYNAGQGEKFLSEVAMTISLLGEDNMCVFADTDDPGVSVIDILEGEITNWSSDWDSVTSTATNGFHTITYTATNSAGHTIQTTRQIEFYSSFDLVPTAANLEEEYDDNGVMTAVTIGSSGNLVNGMFIDSSISSGHVQGNFNNNYKWTSTEEQFSLSSFYRLTDDIIQHNEKIMLFDAFYDVSGTSLGDNGWRFYIQRHGSTNQFRLYVLYNRSLILQSSLFIVNQNEFNHAALVYDNETLKLYNNTALVYENTEFNTLFTSPSHGYYYIGNGSAKCSVDQVEIYKSIALEKCDIAYLANLRGTKDNEFDTNLTELENSLPVVNSLNLEEEYDDNGAITPVTVEGFGKLVNGMYFDTSRNNGHVQGVFNENYKWTSNLEKFSFSSYYRLIEDTVYGSDSIQLFDAWYQHPTGPWDKGWKFYIQRHGATNQFRLYVYYNQDKILQSSLFVVNQNEFNHAAFTYNNGTLRIYHNATLVCENTEFYELFSTPTDGVYTIGNGSAKCAIDQVEIFRGTEFDQQTLDNYSDPTVLQGKDTDYLNNLATYQNTLPVVNSLNLEEEYDDNGVMTSTTVSGFGKLVNGMYFDTSRGNGNVEGVFSNDYKWHEPSEKFSLSAYYRLIEDTVYASENILLFDAYHEVQGTTLGENGWRFYIQRNGATNQFRLYVYYNRAKIVQSSLFAVNQNEFNHAALTFHGGTLRMYNNATLVYENTEFYTLFSNPTHGNYYIGRGSAKCAVDQVEIFKGTEFDQQTLDNYYDSTVLQGKDADFLTNLTSYESSLPVVNSLSLEESYIDSSGQTQSTVINGGGSLINGVYTDTARSGGNVQGDFSNDYKWHEPGEKFSLSALYKFTDSVVYASENILLFDAWYDTPNSAADNGWKFYIQRYGATNQFRFYIKNGRNPVLQSSLFTLNQNDLGYAVLTFHGGTLRMYNNATLVYENTEFYELFSNPTHGNYYIGRGSAKCEVDQVDIRRGTALTQAEIQTTYDNL